VVRHVYPRIVVEVSLHYENPTSRVGLLENGHHHYLIAKKFVLVVM
jgi:hypothetical protein